MEINDEVHAAATFLPGFFFLYGNSLCGIQNRSERCGEEETLFLLLGL